MMYTTFNLSGFHAEYFGMEITVAEGKCYHWGFLFLFLLESLRTKYVLLTVGIGEVSSQILHNIPGQRIRILVVLLKIK